MQLLALFVEPITYLLRFVSCCSRPAYSVFKAPEVNFLDSLIVPHSDNLRSSQVVRKYRTTE